jgi:spoIIIJ-associated protein
MNEKTTLEVIAPTVEEALAQGLAQLGLPAEAVRVEVLDAGTKGLFGLGGRQVRVRLTVGAPDDSTPSPEPPPAPSTQDEKPARATKSKPKAKPKPKPKPESKPAPAKTRVEAVLNEDGEPDKLLDLAEETVSKLLYHLNLQAQVSAHYEQSDNDGRQIIHVDVHGDDLSILIGRRSETLNAFQYITSLMVGKEMQQWVHLVIDVEGYRSRRERQLRQMARKLAEQVIKSGRRQVLEPMPASERRLIHLELRDHPAVSTESVGEDPYRKVTIIPKDT